MTKPLPFNDEEFDLIFHPVSNCYVEEVEPIFKECYRILKKGGRLLCGLDNGINYIFDEFWHTIWHIKPLKSFYFKGFPLLCQRLRVPDRPPEYSRLCKNSCINGFFIVYSYNHSVITV